MESKTVIEKAKSALEDGKKTEALGLYKQGIESMLEEVQGEYLSEEEKIQQKQECAKYLSKAEELQKEITEDERKMEEEIDRYVDALMDLKDTDSTVTLSDVCGGQQVKDQLKECVILPLKFPQLFQGGRLNPWKGIMLYGAPGTGKTMLGKAVVEEFPEITLIKVQGSDLISKLVQEPDKVVKRIFEKARKLKPCLIFIEDLDLLCEDNVKCRRVLSEFLVQKEGIGVDNDQMCVVYTSNKPWNIARSILRRTCKKIYMPLPDKETRKEILQKCFQSVKHEIKDEALETVAKQTEQFTGADLNCLVRDASMEVIREFQTATHFKKIKQTSVCDEDNFQYAVCSPDHPEAIPMSLEDLLKLDRNKLFERAVTEDDLMKCVGKAKPSVDDEYLEKLREFVQCFEDDVKL